MSGESEAPEQPAEPAELAGDVGASEAPAEPPATSPGSSTATGIDWNDRVLVLGYTGAGKSGLLDHLFGRFRCQRLLLDTKGHEFNVLGGDGRVIEPVHDVGAIDWRQPVIHYVDRTGLVDEYQELFEVCRQRQHLIVRVDELADVCEHSPNKTPTAFRQFTTKGRAHGLGLLGASQRPVLMPAAARTEAQHVFLFGPRLDLDDHVAMARAIGRSPDELGGYIDALPRFGFLWWRRSTRELVECPPLNASQLARSIVRRRTVA